MLFRAVKRDKAFGREAAEEDKCWNQLLPWMRNETGEKGLNRKLLDYTFLIKLSKYFSIYHPTSPNIYIFIW